MGLNDQLHARVTMWGNIACHKPVWSASCYGQFTHNNINYTALYILCKGRNQPENNPEFGKVQK